ncbi:murein L,D-transpeptidase [Trebonia kvetii]|uniref:Murein L,D-transpeptidase n=1 Tax=Trebonia kvetii TaxID=2480626 RepID=A0A6P2BL70_9ACTN|nr:peptidoglycan-binding protein [Trebonia kvetii]TVY99639.1 murein L,D-transpeptidase [Trebonia kvetii]
MKDVTDMGALTHGGRLAKFGVTAAAVAAIALCGCTAGTALAAPSASAKPAAVTASAAKAAPSATATDVAKVTTATYVAPKRTLAVGMTGADVKSVQRRLAALKYWPGPIDGQFGTDTQAAVWAFQEINGIKVTGVIDAATKYRLAHPKTYKSPSYKGKRANRIEVSQALEVLVLYKNNKIWLISHVSSGGGYYYNCGSNGCAQAVTPNGTYNTTVYMSGWVKVPLGAMYNPVFFISTVFAIHGDDYVPQGPASHGCVRIPMDVANFFHKMVKTPGTQVHVYGKAQWQK